MKQYINCILAFCLLLGGLSFASCSNDDDDTTETVITETTVGFGNSGINNVVMFDKGDDYFYSFELELQKGGVLSNAASVDLEVVLTAELNAYNTANGTDFVRLAPRTYSIDKMNAEFTGDKNDVTQKVVVSFSISELDPADVNKVLAIKIANASVAVDKENSICILRPQIKESVIRMQNPDVKTITVDEDNPEILNFEISALLDIDMNEWDVDIALESDPQYVAQYNLENGTSYVLATTGFDLESSKIMVAGEKTVSFGLGVSTAKLTKSCMLPIRLRNSSKFDVDQGQYYVLIFDIPDIPSVELSKTDWTIVAFSSEEANGEGANNGHAKHTIDGKDNSFWHTQWQGNKPQPPHWLIIDMQKNYTLTSIALRQRGAGNDGPTKGGKFYLCKTYDSTNPDNSDWTDIGSFNIDAITGDQDCPVSRTTGRYLKVYITDVRSGDKTTSLAEIKPYGYSK